MHPSKRGLRLALEVLDITDVGFFDWSFVGF
jgi:hypothetical protein